MVQDGVIFHTDFGPIVLSVEHHRHPEMMHKDNTNNKNYKKEVY